MSTDPSRPIVLACDAGYAMPLATALRSIVEANVNGCPIGFHVICEGFSASMQARVLESLPRGSASIRWVPADLGLFQEFKTMHYISRMTFARFLIDRIFPEKVSRVLYLDADILVLNDLQPLWETHLEGAVLGAVLDGLDLQIKHGKPDVEHILAKVPRVQYYFNAGVLLIDLKRWREENVSEKAIEYLRRYPQSPFSDQDALNVACDGLWKRLDSRWNFHDRHYEKDLASVNSADRPAIVHFVTSLKPWDARVLSLNSSFYDSFRSRTCFARTSLDMGKDLCQQSWTRIKGAMKRYTLFRYIWRYMKLTRKME